VTPFFDELEQRLRASAAEQHGGAAAAPGSPPAAAAEEDGGAPAAAHARRRGWLRPRGNRRLVVLVVATLLAGAAVPTVPAVTGLWEPDVEPQAPRGTVVSPTRSVSCDVKERTFRSGRPIGPEFAAVLGVFARPRTAADRFPRKHLRSLHLVGLDVRAIRRAGVTAGGRPFYVLPARGVANPAWPARCARRAPPEQRRQLTHPPLIDEPTICVMDGGGACGPLADIARHGSYGSSGTVRGRATISGLAPNGVREIRVTYGTSTETFPVHDNFFTFKVGIDVEQASSPDKLEWLMSDGSVKDVTR
jgi:hypothetical protein